MSDDTDIGNEFEQVDLKEFTLHRPSENFFTETLHLSENIISESMAVEESNRAIENHVLDVIENPSFPLIPLTNWHGGIMHRLKTGKFFYLPLH